MPSERVKNFYDSRSFAVYGMSRTQRNFAWIIFDQLVELEKRVYPIREGDGDYGGVEFYPSLDSLPELPEAVIISLDISKAKGVLDEVRESGIKQVWFQQGSFDDEVMAEACRRGLQPIKGCVMMYMPGSAFYHRLHRAINDLFTKGYQ